MPRARWLLLALLLPWLLVAGRAGGHAVVTRASLDDTPVRAHTPTRVTLHFNSRIEPGFTRVTLLGGPRDAPLAVETASDAGRVVVALPGLAPGTYALRYKVLAADGHVTENTLRFHVTAAE